MDELAVRVGAPRAGFWGCIGLAYGVLIPAPMMPLHLMSEMQKQELLTAVMVHFITQYDDGLERIYETDLPG
jgi:hypothetical protein